MLSFDIKHHRCVPSAFDGPSAAVEDWFMAADILLFVCGALWMVDITIAMRDQLLRTEQGPSLSSESATESEVGPGLALEAARNTGSLLLEMSPEVREIGFQERLKRD